MAIKKLKTKVCVICGKTFETTNYNKITCCPECAHQYKLKHARELYAMRRAQELEERNKAKEEMEAHRNKKKSKLDNDNEINRLSNSGFDVGLSYGQYVAMTEYGARYECIERSKT